MSDNIDLASYKENRGVYLDNQDYLYQMDCHLTKSFRILQGYYEDNLDESLKVILSTPNYTVPDWFVGLRKDVLAAGITDLHRERASEKLTRYAALLAMSLSGVTLVTMLDTKQWAVVLVKDGRAE